MTDSTHDTLGQPEDEFGLSAVRELLRLISETDVTEIAIERGTTKLHIKRGTTPPPSQPPFYVTPSLAAAMPAQTGHVLPPPLTAAPAAGAAGAPTDTAEPEFPAGSLTVVSPMVGTYYSAPSPRDPAFISEGDTIDVGDVVGIVEAMKIMNEIESEYTGTVHRILVTNGQPVEYGQPLIVILPG